MKNRKYFHEYLVKERKLFHLATKTHCIICLYYRDLTEKELLEPPVIYMVPAVSMKIGFTLWDMFNQYNFILQTIPQNIYNYIRTGNLGIFEKIKPAFAQLVRKKLGILISCSHPLFD